MEKKWIIGIACLLVVVLVAVGVVFVLPEEQEVPVEPGPAPPEITPPGPAVAEFEVSDLTVTPSEVKAGEPVTITASVSNIGEQSGTYTLELVIDGEVEARELVTLAGGEEKTVSFAVKRNEPRTYTVRIVRLTETFTVHLPPQLIRPPHELAHIGDFSIALAHVEREEQITALHFGITKVGDTDSAPQSLQVTLIDDHENEYTSSLNIDLEGAARILNALPNGFTYVDIVNIDMPSLAPIERIKLGDKEIAYDKVKFGDPRFLEEFGNLTITKYQSVQVGKWLSFTMEQAIPELPSWKLPITIENKEYNPLPAEVRLGVQNRDGTISWGWSEITDVPALSKTSVRLSLPLRETPPQPRILMLEYIDQKAEEYVLRVFPMPPGKLLPFAVSGEIYEKWEEGAFKLGLPTGAEYSAVSGAEGFDTTGQVQDFEGGQIYYITSGTDAGRTFEIHRGPLLDLYTKLQGSAGWLGFPVRDQYTAASGHPQAEFEAGYIASPDGGTFRAFSYGPGMIAFVSDRDGNKEVYVTDPSGRNQTNLTRNPANDWDPAWSPDGQKIAFVSDRQPQGIYLMNADGTGQSFLVEGEDPSWFPDGSRIIFSRPVAHVRTDFWGRKEKYFLWRIFTIKVDGSDMKEISPDRDSADVRDLPRDWPHRHHFRSPVVSPDGSQIAFTIRRTGGGRITCLYLMNQDGTGLRELVEWRWGQRPGGADPSWSPDGRRIAHRSDPGNLRYLREVVGWVAGGTLQIVAPPDRNPVVLYYKEGSEIWVFGGLDWAPDGRAIVFSGGAKHIGLYITHVDGQILRRLPGKGNNYQPAWGGLHEGVTPTPAAVGKTDLVKALKDLREAMLKKIDFDIDSTAIAFTDVKDYWRTKRWADIFAAPLRVIQGTLSVLAQALDWRSITTEAEILLDASKANYEILSVVTMLQGLQEVGEKLHYGLDGPTYISAIESMLEAADATTEPPFGFSPENYKKVIENHLYGVAEDTPLVIPRKSTTVVRKNLEFASGALEVRSNIARKFNDLIAEIEQGTLPPDFPVDKVVAQLEELELQVIKSQSWTADDIRYETYLWDGDKYVRQEVQTSLGAVGSLYTFFGQTAGNLDKRLELEAKVEVIKALDAVGNAILLYSGTYQIEGAAEGIKVIQKAIVPAELTLKTFAGVFYPNVEEAFYMLPLEMILALPGELSNLWMIADDTDQYLRHLLAIPQS